VARARRACGARGRRAGRLRRELRDDLGLPTPQSAAPKPWLGSLKGLACRVLARLGVDATGPPPSMARGRGGPVVDEQAGGESAPGVLAYSSSLERTHCARARRTLRRGNRGDSAVAAGRARIPQPHHPSHSIQMALTVPPSMTKSAPTTLDARSERMKLVKSATSSGSVILTCRHATTGGNFGEGSTALDSEGRRDRTAETGWPARQSSRLRCNGIPSFGLPP
jgi:hypothetical protein